MSAIVYIVRVTVCVAGPLEDLTICGEVAILLNSFSDFDLTDPSMFVILSTLMYHSVAPV